MNYQQVMAELKQMGAAQNVKVYKRHGAGDNLFGVSFADLNKLTKKIKVDHELAVQLWESGNVDAQSLATMIMDPNKLTASTVNKWVKMSSYYLVVDLFAGVVARSPFGLKKMEQWMKSKREYERQAGYSVLASSLKDGDEISDADCKKYLKVIEKEIHTSPNRARHTMNNAVLAIGVFRPHLAEVATETANRIGKVEVDHGETSCKTPDAVEYIRKALKRRRC